MSVLFRILELESGRIFIDDVDIAAIGLDRLRSSLAIIPQVFETLVLWTGGIMANESHLTLFKKFFFL